MSSDSPHPNLERAQRIEKILIDDGYRVQTSTVLKIASVVRGSNTPTNTVREALETGILNRARQIVAEQRYLHGYTEAEVDSILRGDEDALMSMRCTIAALGSTLPPQASDETCPICEGREMGPGEGCIVGCRNGKVLSTSANVLRNVKPFLTTPQASDERARDLDRRRVVTLARCGLMLTLMAGGEAAEVVGFDAADLYAEVLMALGIEDADEPDIRLEVARDHPEGDLLADDFAPSSRKPGPMEASDEPAQGSSDSGESKLREALERIAYLRPAGPTKNKMVEQMERIAIDALAQGADHDGL